MLIGLYKRSSHIAIADYRFYVRDFRRSRQSDGMWGGGIWDTDDDIGIDRVLPVDCRSQSPPGFVCQLTVQYAVGAGKVNLLENAHRVVGTGARPDL